MVQGPELPVVADEFGQPLQQARDLVGYDLGMFAELSSSLP